MIDTGTACTFLFPFLLDSAVSLQFSIFLDRYVPTEEQLKFANISSFIVHRQTTFLYRQSHSKFAKLATYRQVWRHWTTHGVMTTGYPGRQHLIGGISPRAVMTSARYEPGRAGPAGWARLGRAGRRPSDRGMRQGGGEGRRRWQVTDQFIRVGTPTYREGFLDWKSIERMANAKETWAKGAWRKVDT